MVIPFFVDWNIGYLYVETSFSNGYDVVSLAHILSRILLREDLKTS